MSTISAALSFVVLVFHVGFLILEMFLWTKPVGLKIFRQSAEKASASAVLAANQGLYNGFLAAGLALSFCSTDANVSFALRTYSLSCVVVAGLYGAWSVSRSILFVQAIPAALALAATLFTVYLN